MGRRLCVAKTEQLQETGHDDSAVRRQLCQATAQAPADTTPRHDSSTYCYLYGTRRHPDSRHTGFTRPAGGLPADYPGRYVRPAEDAGGNRTTAPPLSGRTGNRQQNHPDPVGTAATHPAGRCPADNTLRARSIRPNRDGFSPASAAFAACSGRSRGSRTSACPGVRHRPDQRDPAGSCQREDRLSGGDAGTGDGTGFGPGHRLHQASRNPLGTAGASARFTGHRTGAPRFSAHPGRDRPSSRCRHHLCCKHGSRYNSDCTGRRQRHGNPAAGRQREDRLSGGDAGTGNGHGLGPGHRLHQAGRNPLGTAGTAARFAGYRPGAPRFSAHLG